MKFKVLAILLVVLMGAMCMQKKSVMSHGLEEVLISKGFVDDNTYKIVCRGYPLEGLSGIQKIESSKRAALLNAYYFVKNMFNDSIAPDTDGKAAKFDVASDHAVVHYVISKKGLKNQLKKEE